jgi:hypothetical protein
MVSILLLVKSNNCVGRNLAFYRPLLQQVIVTRKPVWFEDQLVPFYRNGKVEDIYWTFSYSPAFGEDNEVKGVLVTCMETTKSVLERQEK